MKFLKVFIFVAVVALGLAVGYGLSPIRPMREIFTFTTIDAPKQQVWQVLTTFSAYRQWNPFYTSVDGKCEQGARLHIDVRTDNHTLTYAPQIKRVVPQEELVWSEQLVLPGLFDGEHSFVLESKDGAPTRFVQHDRYSGALVPLLMGLYQPDAEAGFRRMNDALKKRAEQESSVNAQL